MELAPIILFTYKRLDTLRQTIKALADNTLAADSLLYIYSDGGGNPGDQQKITELRSYLRTIAGFKEVIIRESPINKGLAKSIITGVTEVIAQHGTAIVLEDDLLTSKNFLEFMNKSLHFYRDDNRILSISGFSFPMRRYAEYGYDVYFTMRASSWGWATWSNRWQNIDWQVSDFADFAKDRQQQRAFNRMGSDLTHMLTRQMNNKINSWAIRFVYHQFRQNMYTVFPLVSKIKNIGWDNNATNTSQRFNRFDTTLDSENKNTFRFKPDPDLNPVLVNQFKRPFGLFQRGLYKILNSFSK
ncbi:MAG: glycosyltransferase [Chitinophagaceae bacterium]|nr:MAG: glycosyltransferase [Chitinophagaceae bacterium]